MIQAIVIFALVLGVLIVVMAARTVAFSSKQMKVEPIGRDEVDAGAASGRLAGAIRFRTISYQDPEKMEVEEFLGLHKYLEDNFPGVHRELKKEIVADYSLLYTWEGRETGLKPILLMSHIDVVPVEQGTEGDWEYPPFEGRVADGFVWGRGTMDVKSGVTGLLEAVEKLLGEGFRPRRTVYLAFGHDEEVGGGEGARAVASLLKSRGVRLEYVIDEGGAVIEGAFPGIKAPIAFVGIAEKGYLSLELVVEGEGGHASTPPLNTAIGVLGRALHRLERRQFPARLNGVEQTFRHLGPEMPPVLKVLAANRRLFSPLIKKLLSRKRETNAAIRTTIAPTMLEGSRKENVLPAKAKAVVNFRILQGDTIDGVVAHVRRAIGDPRVKINVLKRTMDEPSPVSDVESESFQMLQRIIQGVFPGVIVAPSTVLGATDARHYAPVSDSVYRFIPERAGPDDLNRVHGTNERISVENHAEIVTFFMQVIRNS
ncbi:MAG: M20 family peptidase [bacterium]